MLAGLVAKAVDPCGRTRLQFGHVVEAGEQGRLGGDNRVAACLGGPSDLGEDGQVEGQNTGGQRLGGPRQGYVGGLGLLQGRDGHAHVALRCRVAQQQDARNHRKAQGKASPQAESESRTGPGRRRRGHRPHSTGSRGLRAAWGVRYRRRCDLAPQPVNCATSAVSCGTSGENSRASAKALANAGRFDRRDR